MRTVEIAISAVDCSMCHVQMEHPRSSSRHQLSIRSPHRRAVIPPTYPISNCRTARLSSVDLLAGSWFNPSEGRAPMITKINPECDQFPELASSLTDAGALTFMSYASADSLITEVTPFDLFCSDSGRRGR